MIIYGALFIPLIVAFILFKFFNHKSVWWELFIPLFTSLIFIFLMKTGIEAVQVQSNEYWGSFVSRVEYYEPWNEYIHRTCTKSCGKNCTTTYDCSYVDYHSPHWELITTTGENIGITERQYNQLKVKFGNENFIELNRNYHTLDGNEYCSYWQKDSASATTVTTSHSYENRIKAADQSVFHFEKVKDVDIKRYSLKEYPKIYDNYKIQSVIGDTSKDALIADKKVSYINGLLGRKKQVRVFILIFKDQPIDAGLYQEWYWSGGNKNEFIICVGIDKQRNVRWCKPFSWTTNESLKAEVKDFVQSQSKLNISSIADFTRFKVEKEFVRRSFKEFNYLTVEPPLWAEVLTYVLTILINLGLSFWIINNEYED